jgi:hypothetical protein
MNSFLLQSLEGSGGCPTVIQQDERMRGRSERAESSGSPKGYAMNHCPRDYLVIVSLSRPMISSSDIFPLVPLSIDRLISLIHSLKWWESSDHNILSEDSYPSTTHMVTDPLVLVLYLWKTKWVSVCVCVW